MVKDKLIVALDFHTKEDALALVDKLGATVFGISCNFKSKKIVLLRFFNSSIIYEHTL